MADILLTTINARYAHTSIALRYLYANLRELQKQCSIYEFILGADLQEMAETVLKENPRIVGISVSIWNAAESVQLVRLLKLLSPETTLILGGPEVSHPPLRLDYSNADYIISGEGETVFRDLCKGLLSGKAPEHGTMAASGESLEELLLPYRFYTDHDLANRVVYVESSRGCPFVCEFCLSSIDRTVRYFDLNRILEAFERLWRRGARHYKFIDRTFNLDPRRAAAILDFFLNKKPPYLVHFEVVPDHFPEEIRSRLKQFPPASLQLEVGIQTLDPQVAANIRRKIDPVRIQENLHFLENETNIHLHTDLIIGLPGETPEGFGKNLDRLVSWTSAEVQIGMLKKLSGTSINRHDRAFGMVYSSQPPYTILKNELIPFPEMQRLRRLAKFWDLVYNRGNFKETVLLLFENGRVYTSFSLFSLWLYQQTGSTHSIALNRMARYLFAYLTEERKIEKNIVADRLTRDLLQATGKTPPSFLREQTLSIPGVSSVRQSKINRRQRKHL